MRDARMPRTVSIDCELKLDEDGLGYRTFVAIHL